MSAAHMYKARPEPSDRYCPSGPEVSITVTAPAGVDPDPADRPLPAAGVDPEHAVSTTRATTASPPIRRHASMSTSRTTQGRRRTARSHPPHVPATAGSSRSTFVGRRGKLVQFDGRWPRTPFELVDVDYDGHRGPGPRSPFTSPAASLHPAAVDSQLVVQHHPSWTKLDTDCSTELDIVDEADRLKTAGMEQLRDFFDRRDLGLILIGMPVFDRQLGRCPQN